MKVGRNQYRPIEVLYVRGRAKLTIGNYCSIAPNVKFFLGGGHNYKKISTFPFRDKLYNGYGRSNRGTKLDIVVEDDVWIGYDCIILPGSKIGKGSVVGARSVVTGTIPPYSVYVVNKVIKKRFPQAIIDRIQHINYSNINHNKGDLYQAYCDTEITEENIEEIISAFVKQE